MAVEIPADEGDRIVIELHPGGPVELHDLSGSFAALARMYERHYRKEEQEAPKLYVTRLETGSVIMEIAPVAMLMGAIAYMENAVVVAEFTNRLWKGIKTFASPQTTGARSTYPSREDALDIREFTKPLLGREGAHLGLRHARFEKSEGEKQTVIEYRFDEAELNRAALNIEKALELPPPPDAQEAGRTYFEKMLFLEQAARGPGKEKGRTGDRGMIPDVSERVVPVYFHRRLQPLKERMMQGAENPFELVFVVDVHVTVVGGVIKGYTVLEIHESFPRE